MIVSLRRVKKATHITDHYSAYEEEAKINEQIRVVFGVKGVTSL